MNQKNKKQESNWEFSVRILQDVSRTFALNINKLEGDTHRAVLIGYLLFRIADCFEDSPFQGEEEKAENLRRYIELFQKDSREEALSIYRELKDIWPEDSPERELLMNGEKVFDVYFGFSPEYREIISRHIIETSEGMAEFQLKKARSGKELYQLKDTKELERYCYFVAGVVGKMLTDICCVRENIKPYREEMKKNEVSYGISLQLINVLKDWQKDIKRGWLYIPKTVFDYEEGIPEKLEVVTPLIDLVIDKLHEALSYIKSIPEEELDVRLFSIIPVVLAYNTLLYMLKGKGNKITREMVYQLLEDSEKFAADNSLLEKDLREKTQILSNLSRNS
ncbi:MAG: squalene/phytoene synthase family protein [Elusimicrobiota bacterium]